MLLELSVMSAALSAIWLALTAIAFVFVDTLPEISVMSVVFVAILDVFVAI